MGVCRRLNRNVNSFRYALHVLLLDASMVGAEEPRLEIRKGEVDMGQNVHRPLFFSLDLGGCKVLRAVVRDSKFVGRDPSPHSVGTLKFRSRRSLGPRATHLVVSPLGFVAEAEQVSRLGVRGRAISHGRRRRPPMPQPPQAPVQPEFQAFTEGYTAGLRAALDLVPHCSHPFAAGSDHTVRTHQPDDCARCQLGAALAARAPGDG